MHPLLAHLTDTKPIQVAYRYIKSSHQDDPARTALELLLFGYIVYTWLRARTREKSARNFVQLSPKEVDELVAEWLPEPLIAHANMPAVPHAPLTVHGPASITPTVAYKDRVYPGLVNLSSVNFSGLLGKQFIKDKAIQCMRKYGVGACGPPGFYGTFDVHMDLEHSLARFIGLDYAIIYAQAFATVASVIPSFSKRGDLIVADKGVSFAVQKGIQISRSRIRWYEHANMDSLEEVLKAVDREDRRAKRPPTRRFIITEGLFENDGHITDLPRIIELKKRYKYRLILDESWSFGTLGKTGRGLTEYHNVDAKDVEILVGSMANGLNSAGGFCAGSAEVVNHQRINSPAFVYSASLPPLLAVSATEGMKYLQGEHSSSSTLPLSLLQSNTKLFRSILDPLPCITIPSDPASPLIHILITDPPIYDDRAPSPTSFIDPSSPSAHDDDYMPLPDQERLLIKVQEVCLERGVLVTLSQKVNAQEMLEWRPSLQICMSSDLSQDQVKESATTLKNALLEILGRKVNGNH